MTSVQVPRTESRTTHDDVKSARTATCTHCEWTSTEEKPIDVDQAAHQHTMATGHTTWIESEYSRYTTRIVWMPR